MCQFCGGRGPIGIATSGGDVVPCCRGEAPAAERLRVAKFFAASVVEVDALSSSEVKDLSDEILGSRGKG